MKNYDKVLSASIGNGFNRMTYEDAGSIARISRSLSGGVSSMTYGQALKCRWAKIRSGLSI